MKIVIFGVGGFIGSNLAEYLIARDQHEIVGVDIDGHKLEGIGGTKFTFVHADVTKSPQLAGDLVQRADVVVDLMAYANPSIYVESPLEVIELNYFENLRIAELCVEHHTRLIQYSTSEVYGKKPRDAAFNEDSSDLILGPVSKQRWVYAAAKQLLERTLHGYGLGGDLDYTIVRPFNFVGPRFDYLVPAGSKGGPRVFAHFMSALLTGGPMYLVDGGSQHRSFTHIDDASDAFTVLLENPSAHNEIFNIGNPATDCTIRELALLMQRLYAGLTGTTPQNELREISGEEFYGRGYEDADRVPPDVSKLEGLGWKPRRNLETTFRDAIEYNLDPSNQRRPLRGAR
jgi:UDP-apiose/xylose synthase